MRITGISPETNRPITVVAEGGTITAVELGVNRPDLGSEDLFIAPGMIDMMAPGYGGRSFSDPDLSQDDIGSILQEFYKHGTTHIYPLPGTSAPRTYEKVLPAIDSFAGSQPTGKSIVGVHVEGPYISDEDGPRGAHSAEYTRDPDIEEFKGWHEVSGRRIAIITVAPERMGSVEFITLARKLGVKVAIGHTAATAEQLDAAILAGADMSTHLGNGAHAMIHRWDNYIFRQLIDDRLWAGVIADGHHLPDSNLKIWFRTKGWRKIVLVSDVSPQAGQAPGVYKRPGDKEVRVEPSGRISVNDGSGNLAGAGHLLDRAVAKALQMNEFNLDQCLAMATANPAAYMGLKHLGALAPGKEASIFLFDREIGAELNIRHTILAGEVVYSA